MGSSGITRNKRSKAKRRQQQEGSDRKKQNKQKLAEIHKFWFSLWLVNSMQPSFPSLQEKRWKNQQLLLERPEDWGQRAKPETQRDPGPLGAELALLGGGWGLLGAGHGLAAELETTRGQSLASSTSRSLPRFLWWALRETPSVCSSGRDRMRDEASKINSELPLLCPGSRPQGKPSYVSQCDLERG